MCVNNLAHENGTGLHHSCTDTAAAPRGEPKEKRRGKALADYLDDAPNPILKISSKNKEIESQALAT